MKLRAHVDADLTRIQIEQLAGRLAEKRHELAERVVDLEQQITIKDDCSLTDAADAASLQENRLRARGMVEQHQKTIAEIGAALRRLENGRYGVSETTGEPIAYDRLLLIPWARTGSGEGE
jgi:DnaK suppressor protein